MTPTEPPKRPRCKGVTTSGIACIAYARKDCDYCAGHDPLLESLHKANGAKRKRWKGTREQLQTHAGIAEKLRSLYERVEQGKLELSKARTLGGILSKLMVALDGVDARLGQGRDAPPAAPTEPLQQASGDDDFT